MINFLKENCPTIYAMVILYVFTVELCDFLNLIFKSKIQQASDENRFYIVRSDAFSG